MQKETRWGPEYNPDISKFFARGASKNPFYSDEVYDFLVGEKQGNRIYPYRLKSRDGNPRVLSDFRKNLKKSWVVESSPEDDEYVLLHKVQPGRRRDRLGKRKFTPGWRIVPHKKYVIPIIAQVPFKFFFFLSRGFSRNLVRMQATCRCIFARHRVTNVRA